MNSKPDITKATPRPWHRHDMEHDSICGPDRKAIALVFGRSRNEDEDDENLRLIVQAVNEYEALNAVAEAASVALEPYKRDITGKPTAEAQHKLCVALSALTTLRNQK